MKPRLVLDFLTRPGKIVWVFRMEDKDRGYFEYDMVRRDKYTDSIFIDYFPEEVIILGSTNKLPKVEKDYITGLLEFASDYFIFNKEETKPYLDIYNNKLNIPVRYFFYETVYSLKNIVKDKKFDLAILFLCLEKRFLVDLHLFYP